jgi:hypothetical protein
MRTEHRSDDETEEPEGTLAREQPVTLGKRSSNVKLAIPCGGSHCEV